MTDQGSIDLTGMLERFRAGRQRLIKSADHLIPDLVLDAYLEEIEEQVSAVAILSESPFAHRAYPNARAAFEAGQLITLLVTDENYDLAGAKAWVYQMRVDRKYMKLPREAPRQSVDPDSWFKIALDEIASTWDDLAPGKGQLLYDADAALQLQPQRPDNWAGVNIVPELEKRYGALLSGAGKDTPAIRGPINAAYAALSRESHGRARVRIAAIDRRPDGSLDIHQQPRDAHAATRNVRTAASTALLDGGLAMDLRLRMT